MNMLLEDGHSYCSWPEIHPDDPETVKQEQDINLATSRLKYVKSTEKRSRNEHVKHEGNYEQLTPPSHLC